jgi:Protein of unknown function (DUF2442)
MNIAVAQLIETDLERCEIKAVVVSEDSLTVDLQDGRTIAVPILWYPRLAYANPQEQLHMEIRRNVIRWPDLDEEISVRGLLLGRKSGENSASLQRWLSQRNATSARQ